VLCDISAVPEDMTRCTRRSRVGFTRKVIFAAGSVLVAIDAGPQGSLDRQVDDY